MKLGLMKRVLATALCMAMFLGDVLPATAMGSVSGGDAADFLVEEVAEEEATVSGSDVVEIEEEEVPLTATLEDIVLETEVSGVTITLTAPAGAVPEDAVLWAEEIDQTADLAIIDEALEAEEEKAEIEVQQYKAFDIKILVDGEEVQPTEEVTVSFAGDILLPQNEEESVVVYHVTEDAVASDMEAVVVNGETVEMETDHFSIYVIVKNEGWFNRQVTFKHYLGSNNDVANAQQIYAPETIQISSGKEKNVFDYVQGGGNFKVDTVVVKKSGKLVETYQNTGDNVYTLKLENAPYTVEFYYSESTEKDKDFKTTFYDYYIDTPNYEDVEIYTGDMLYNFQVGDKNVSGTSGVYYVSKLEATVCTLTNNELNDVITLMPGDAIKNVIRKNGAGSNDSKREWNEVIFVGGKFCVRAEGYAATKSAGINAENYVEGMPFLAMGISNDTNDVTTGTPNYVTCYSDYAVKKEINGKTVYVNINANNTDPDGVNDGERAIVPGLITGLTNDGSVIDMGVAYPITSGWHDGKRYHVESIDETKPQEIREPGYFVEENTINKRVYKNYKLFFDRVGNEYSLDYALNTNKKDEEQNKIKSWASGTPWVLTGENAGAVNKKFLPLNDVEKIGGRTEYQGYWSDEYYNNANNFYFGMRYDFTFKLGSYIGPMEYEFYGDDDLWVFVDGELVMDLGGMHSAYPGKYKVHNEPNKVDLWSEVFDIDTTKEDWWESRSYRNIDKNEEHTVTILYMERGGYESTCAMRFVIPNVETKEPTIVTTEYAKLEINKIEKDSNNTALENVTFTLTDSEKNVVGTATTNSQGYVAFDKLTSGTYTLTENELNGYYPAGPWTVEVEGEANQAGDKIVYSIVSVKDDSKGAALTANNGIYTIENEKILPAITQEKTVEVANWDERTYKITLNASSLVQKVETVGGSVDIVLTLDVSGSMDGSKLATLKTAVCEFIDKIAEVSPKSRIAIVSFGHDGVFDRAQLTEVGTNKNSLKTAVNSLGNDSGGTPIASALERAYGIIEGSKNSKYVVLVSDGDSNNGGVLNKGNDNSDVDAPAEDIRKIATLMTMGVECTGHYADEMKEWATQDCAYNANQAEDMVDVLDIIGKDIIDSLPVTGASVVDYIDNRFEAVTVNANGEVVSVLGNEAKITDTKGNEGTLVIEENGTAYVKWDDATIESANQNVAGWTAEIYVKAKDEFIGGNFIPTNGDKSGIKVDDEFFPFDKPTTNVKLLTIDIADKKIDLFKGENIVPADYVAELNDTLSVFSIEEEPVPLGGAPKLTEDQVKDLMNGNSLTVPYSYNNDKIGSFVYTLNSKYDWQTHVAEKVGDKVESYELHVYFKALTEDERKNELGEGYVAPVEGTPVVTVTTPTEIGCYTVNVIAGTLTIKKTIDLSKVNFQQGDPIFTFKVMKDGQFYSYHTVRYTENSKDNTVTVATLTELAKGVYTVEELDSLRYNLVSVEAYGADDIAENDADMKINANIATFGIGRDIKSADTQVDNLEGVATFTNERTHDRYYSHTDVVVNKFEIKDGTISWTADSLEK